LKLIEIDGVKVSSATHILIKIFPEQEKIELAHLYPFYPQLSGIDVLQFISALSFTCKFKIEGTDDSDFMTPFYVLFGQSYYKTSAHRTCKKRYEISTK
jgi:hypothetical protein